MNRTQHPAGQEMGGLSSQPPAERGSPAATGGLYQQPDSSGPTLRFRVTTECQFSVKSRAPCGLHYPPSCAMRDRSDSEHSASLKSVVGGIRGRRRPTSADTGSSHGSIGRMPRKLPGATCAAPSPERGYRLASDPHPLSCGDPGFGVWPDFQWVHGGEGLPRLSAETPHLRCNGAPGTPYRCGWKAQQADCPAREGRAMSSAPSGTHVANRAFEGAAAPTLSV